jgi:hypothetical protein
LGVPLIFRAMHPNKFGEMLKMHQGKRWRLRRHLDHHLFFKYFWMSHSFAEQSTQTNLKKSRRRTRWKRWWFT